MVDGVPELQGHRHTTIRVDLENIRRNVRMFSARLGDDVQLMAVVKADAYGHGAVPVARAALEAGASRLGVALVEEAEQLREAGFDGPLHLLFEPPPASAGRVVELGLIPTVYSQGYADALAAEAKRQGIGLQVHIKLDTGMHRVGVAPGKLLGLARCLAFSGVLKIEGLYTHLAMAAEPSSPFTVRQMEVFQQCAEQLEKEGIQVPLLHAAASGAAMSYPDAVKSMVRLGIAMYGCYPSEEYRTLMSLAPALELTTEVAEVMQVRKGEGLSYGLTHRFEQDARVGLLPIGYADGLFRVLSNRMEVLIRGQRCRQVGTICMDLCMVDLGNTGAIQGDEVVIIGSQGGEHIDAEEVAAHAGTINYEVLCHLTRRVPRLYVSEQTEAID